MTLLVDIMNSSWMSPQDFGKEVQDLDPSQVRFYPDIGEPGEISMLATDRLRPGLVAQLPSLKLIQKLGVGVDTMVKDPDLPAHVRITRVRTQVTAMEMARFCLGYVLRDVHNMEFHRVEQQAVRWTPIPPRRVPGLVVGVLGLGNIGGTCARMFSDSGFDVIGWSRSPKQIVGVQSYHGQDGLAAVLQKSDYLVSVLPATVETDNMFNRELFASMKNDAMMINVGRGTLVVEADLVAALDDGLIRHAVLDVCQVEPLPESSPMWTHPGITITPHVSGWDVDDGFKVVSENYRRLVEDRDLLNEVDREAGY